MICVRRAGKVEERKGIPGAGRKGGVGGPERVPELARLTRKLMGALRYAGGIRPDGSNQQRRGDEGELNRERICK